jgi:hypothetical protein
VLDVRGLLGGVLFAAGGIAAIFFMLAVMYVVLPRRALAGSILTVTKFDRFARDVADAHAILTDLSERGMFFGLGASVYDWKDPFGRLFLQTLAMVAEFEANIGHLRTHQGMAKARDKASSAGNNPSCRPQPPAPSAGATPTARYPWPTSPRNTPSADPPSTASSTDPTPTTEHSRPDSRPTETKIAELAAGRSFESPGSPVSSAQVKALHGEPTVFRPVRPALSAEFVR